MNCASLYEIVSTGFNTRFSIFNFPYLRSMSLSWDDFEKVDIRTGTIVEAREFPEARNPAYILMIDFGDLGLKKTSAQITNLYKPDDLIGKQVVAVVNFPPKQIGPIQSECLVLGAVQADNTVVLLETEQKTGNGLRIK